MRKAKDILIKNLGGYTIMEANGGWIGDDGTEFQEYTLVIMITDTTEEQVHEVSAQLQEAFHQSSILINTTPITYEFYDANSK